MSSGAEVGRRRCCRSTASDGLLIDPDKPFHAASTMKVPVMIELFRQADAGRCASTTRSPIKNEFHSIVDGSVYR